MLRYAPVAQRIERRRPKSRVGGSSPSRGTSLSYKNPAAVQVQCGGVLTRVSRLLSDWFAQGRESSCGSHLTRQPLNQTGFGIWQVFFDWRVFKRAKRSSGVIAAIAQLRHACDSIALRYCHTRLAFTRPLEHRQSCLPSKRAVRYLRKGTPSPSGRRDFPGYSVSRCQRAMSLAK